MLVTLQEAELEKYIDFAYALTQDLSKSCYPIYVDGIKTQEDFADTARRSFEKEEDEIFLFYYEGNLEGWIQYYYIPEDKYLSCESFNVSHHYKAALQEFLDFAMDKFPGYEFYFGCSVANRDAITFLKDHGFRLIEESHHDVLHFERYEPKEEKADIRRITKENYEDFRKIHIVDDEMYWNSDRIYEEVEKWFIYGYYEGEDIVGAVYFVDTEVLLEIFGVDMKNDEFDPVIMRELMTKTLNEGKRMGAKHLVCFSSEEESEVLVPLGFEDVDRYQCYLRTL